jgi:hypothetical protein
MILNGKELKSNHELVHPPSNHHLAIMFNKMLLPACCLVWLVKILLQLHCNYESETDLQFFLQTLLSRTLKKTKP